MACRARALGDRLTVIVNTGDDCTSGFTSRLISTPLCTRFTASPIPEQGWDLVGETWNFMDQIAAGRADPIGSVLGDCDTAMYALRTEKACVRESVCPSSRPTCAARST